MVLAILRALVVAMRRDLAGFGPLRTNNFFLFVALLIWGAAASGVEPASAYPFLALLAFLLAFPASGDPLEKVPETRWGVWPLSRRTRAGLRAAALAMNPILWIAGAIIFRDRHNLLVGGGAIAAGVAIRSQAAGYGRDFRVGRLVPVSPPGPGLFFSERLRSLLAALDTWLAFAIAVTGSVWRMTATWYDPAAPAMLSVLVGIALSTLAQCGADLRDDRYKLLPLRPPQLLIARDGALLALHTLFGIALSPLTGLTFGFTSLAIGRYPALHTGLRIERWRFTGGRVLFGTLQMAIGAGLAMAGWIGLAIALGLWIISLHYGASVLAQRFGGGRSQQQN